MYYYNPLANWNDRGYYTANASRLTVKSQGFKILDFIAANDGATKYECVTEALGKTGTKQELRGYYCVTFQGWVRNGILSYDKKTYKYQLTAKGAQAYVKALKRG